MNPNCKVIHLIGGNGYTVMDFARWGMGSAAPRFQKGGFMERADVLGVVVAGREHHQHWYKGISHPDANLIAQAPNMLNALKEAEVGLEFAGADKVVPEGRFVPAPTLALRAVRAAIALAEGKEVQSV
jgi:hypothetical protein